MNADGDGLLAIYLNDHLAGATIGVELARRARGANEGTELGGSLARIAAEIEEDREVLVAVMDRLGVGRDRVKSVFAWAGEKAGRLKLNGRLLGYSPLSRVEELEALSIAVEGKARLWRMLRELADPRLEGFDFEALLARAGEQRDGLERHRIAAGLEAFGAARSAKP